MFYEIRTKVRTGVTWLEFWVGWLVGLGKKRYEDNTKTVRISRPSYALRTLFVRFDDRTKPKGQIFVRRNYLTFFVRITDGADLFFVRRTYEGGRPSYSGKLRCTKKNSSYEDVTKTLRRCYEDLRTKI